ncbi:hypothetical protein ABPG72_011632 [Tetrahymena utriculariae]
MIIEAGPAQRTWAKSFNKLQFNQVEDQIKKGFQQIMSQNKKNQLIMLKNQIKEDICTFDYLKKLITPNLNSKILSNEIENINDVIDFEMKNDKFESSILWKQYTFEWFAPESTRNFIIQPSFYQKESQLMIEHP